MFSTLNLLEVDCFGQDFLMTGFGHTSQLQEEKLLNLLRSSRLGCSFLPPYFFIYLKLFWKFFLIVELFNFDILYKF